MTGTIVNVVAIIAGSLIGFFLRGGIPKRIQDTLMQGLALCVLLIGIQGVLKGTQMMLIIFSIVIGAIIGELIDIDKWLNKLGDLLERKLGSRGGRVSEAFVTASLLYCVGAMAILGAIQDGLMGNSNILFQKAILDGVMAVTFASTLGIGVIFSTVPVFLYQGSIAIMASTLSGILTPDITNQMTAVGSLLIIGIATNMLKITKIKLANLLPAVLIPIIYELLCMGYTYGMHLISK